MTTRRGAPLHVSLLPLLLLALACSGGSPRAEPALVPTGAPLSIAAYYWPGQYWVDVANDKGWFREAGLNVHVVDTNADYFGSIRQFVGGASISRSPPSSTWSSSRRAGRTS